MKSVLSLSDESLVSASLCLLGSRNSRHTLSASRSIFISTWLSALLPSPIRCTSSQRSIDERQLQRQALNADCRLPVGAAKRERAPRIWTAKRTAELYRAIEENRSSLRIRWKEIITKVAEEGQYKTLKGLQERQLIDKYKGDQKNPPKKKQG